MKHILLIFSIFSVFLLIGTDAIRLPKICREGEVRGKFYFQIITKKNN